MIEQLLAWKTIVIGIWLALFFTLERCFPATPWKLADPDQHFSQSRHLVQNAALWLINLLLSPLLVIGVTLFAAGHGLAWRQQWIPQTLGPAGIILDLLLLDLWIYAWHRINHRLPFLWRFHQVHHLDQQLDATSALRFHIGEVALSALLRAPVIVIFAIPLASVIVFETLVTVAAIFHHANVRLPAAVERRLALFIITPSIHWVHHHAVREDTDSNYGTVLSCWDRLFHSLSKNRRTEQMPLGVDNLVENRLPQLLLLPLRKGS